MSLLVDRVLTDQLHMILKRGKLVYIPVRLREEEEDVLSYISEHFS